MSSTSKIGSGNVANKGDSPNHLDEYNCENCGQPDSVEDMVECEVCKLWYHYSCAGVNSAVRDKRWSCKNCKKDPSVRSRRTKSSCGSQISVNLELQRLEAERVLEEKRRQEKSAQCKAHFLEQQALLAKCHESRLAEFTERQKSDQEYLNKKFALLQIESQENIYEEDDELDGAGDHISEQGVCSVVSEWLNRGKLNELRNTALNPTTQRTRWLTQPYCDLPNCGEEMDARFNDNNCIRSHQGAPSMQLEPDPRYNRFTSNLKYCSKDNKENNNPNSKVECLNQNDNVMVQQNKAIDEPIRTNHIDESQKQIQLTTQQLSSRQALAKELPYFSGKAEEWPLFISRYETSTKICGFTDDENLMRLQKALKGDALDAVRSRLLLPKNVSKIISTLRKLYGKPEIIINELIRKLKSESAPRIEKLETITKYSLAVENLHGTMEAAGLQHHITNPILLQELVDKLPSQLKIDWARNIMVNPMYDLSTFSAWLTQLAESLYEINLNNNVAVIDKKGDAKRSDNKSNYDKRSVHVHSEDVQNNTKGSERKKCRLCAGVCSSVKNCEKFKNLALDDKWKAVKKYQLCRTCLNSHIGVKCKSNNKCGKNGCIYRHNTLLHNENNGNERDMQATAEPPEENHVVANHHSCTVNNHNQEILFRIIPVVLHGADRKVETFAFLDEGSSVTLIDQNVTKQLGLNGTLEPLCLRWTASAHRVEKRSQKITLGISGINGHSKYTIKNARTVESLELPKQSLSADRLSKQYNHLKGLPFTSYENAIPQILIGLDNAKLSASLKIKEGEPNQPIAVKTRLGWNIYGSLSSNINISDHFNGFHVCDCERSNDENLQKIVKEYISLDNLGVSKPNRELMSNDDQRSLQIMKATTERKSNGHFETGLLWRFDCIMLPDSLNMAKHRFDHLEKKMAREPELKRVLIEKISQYIEKGYIRRLSENELKVNHPRVWYLPMFTVTNPNKPGKIRMVWDAAAKVGNISLNSMLLTGPDNLTSLPAVLQRFRERKIAVCADIREMFHQIFIKHEDQDSQRFLWRDDSNGKLSIYVMNVMTFGATCSPSCAQYVKNKNAEAFKLEYPRAVQSIVENHYVDDLLDSFDNEEEAINISKQVQFIHAQGGFEIRNWLANSTKVKEAFDNNDRTVEKNLDVASDESMEKVLGMWWRTTTDTFTYSLKYNNVNKELLMGQRRPTKRELLRILMKLYDPLGLIANFLIYLKIILQEVWKSSTCWDEPIADEQWKKWLIWVNKLKDIQEIEIPRWYNSNPAVNRSIVQLHVFVDASEKAYAAVAYFRFGDKEIECSLVAAKTRVAPIKPLSIPRLELQAAVLGLRLALSVAESHSIKITERVFWTDSKTVISWLKSEARKFRQFVAFRVGEILESSDVSEWNWIPTKQNVADEATKWQGVPNFNPRNRWFNGPEFLKLPREQWPQCVSPITNTSEEIRIHMVHVQAIRPPIVDYHRFSKWSRLLRAVAYLFRFIHNTSPKNNGKRFGALDRDELQRAENYLHQQAQNEEYHEEINLLRKNKILPDDQKLYIKKSSPLYKQSAYLDENEVLRVSGRIDAVKEVSRDVKRPIILPRTHYITKLIIQFVHQKYYHHNQETVVNEIRQKYSIPKLRATIKKEYNHCQHCKNKRATPQPPEMGSLPPARLSSFTRPFSYIGIDYFGPLTVAIGRRTEKRWGVLITCLTIRAIHIEIAHSLSTDSCILCLRNFMSRRGVPIEIFSDNGTNFHGADRELQLALVNVDQQRLASEFNTCTTKWTFIPPAAPHMGGSWERLVKSVKKTLYEIMPSRNPSDELLSSMLIEVENVVNSRPLTYCPVEDDIEEALTPNHFLLGSSNGIKPIGDLNYDCSVLRKNWRISQRYADSFWRRWVREYLPTLTRRTKWFQPVKPIVEGDIVIIIDERSLRNTWERGKVLKVKRNKDGQVRSATIQTAKGIYERPAVKLAILDVRSTNEGKANPDTIAIPGGNVATREADSHHI